MMPFCWYAVSMKPCTSLQATAMALHSVRRAAVARGLILRTVYRRLDLGSAAAADARYGGRVLPCTVRRRGVGTFNALKLCRGLSLTRAIAPRRRRRTSRRSPLFVLRGPAA